ncbi:MAG: tetratricopeptide repeat protein, partial [Acidobacteriota bacterium]
MQLSNRKNPGKRGLFIGLLAGCLFFLGQNPQERQPWEPGLSPAGDFKEGIRLRQEGRYVEAFEFFQEKLRQARTSENAGRKIFALIQLGDLLWNEGKLQDSEPYYYEASEIAGRNNLKEIREKTTNILDIFKYYKEGKKFRSAGDYEKSEKSFTKAIELSEKINSPDHKLKCLRQLSVTYWCSFDFTSFRKLNEEALALARKLNHTREVGMCLNNLGIYHWKKNDYSRALVYCHEALEIARKLNNPSLESDCLNNIGVIYIELGILDKSHQFLNKALEIALKLGNEHDVASILVNLGRVSHLINRKYEDKNKFLKESLEHLERSLSISKKLDNKNIT